MEQSKIINLIEMELGETGRIVKLRGGKNFLKRLETLGVMTGVELTKISEQFAGGPVIIQIKNSRIAIGHNMAKRILVEVNEIEKNIING